LGAEKSGATKARPEARLWLRDYLGRQAGGFGRAAGERGIMKERRGEEGGR